MKPAGRRALWIIPGGISLLAGLDAALVRLGLTAPLASERLGDRHGALMVFGFLATLVCLERAVALRHSWAFAAPGLLGAGGIAMVLPLHLITGQLLVIAGWVAAIAVYLGLWRRQRDPATSVELLAAVLGLGGALRWLQADFGSIVPWLVAFVVLTIAAERVELARLAMPADAGRHLLIAAAALTACTLATALWPDPGARAFGLALLGLVGWLVRQDVARRTIRGQGLTRYSAAAMLAGYAWLAVAAATWAYGGAPAGERGYDIVVHGVFLGFAMSMVMAHAPIVLPAVVRRPLPYRRRMWAPLIVLHAGLLVRLGGGGLLGLTQAWLVGSVITVIAVLLFLVAAVSSAATRQPGKPRNTHEVGHTSRPGRADKQVSP